MAGGHEKENLPGAGVSGVVGVTTAENNY